MIKTGNSLIKRKKGSRMDRMIHLVIALILPLMLFSFVIPGNATEEEEINKLIVAAKTPEDHIKIADYYEKQAAKLEQEASFHASLAASYKNRSKPLSGLAMHCSDLSKKYKGAAKDYKAMAMEHMKMAQEVKKK